MDFRLKKKVGSELRNSGKMFKYFFSKWKELANNIDNNNNIISICDRQINFTVLIINFGMAKNH